MDNMRVLEEFKQSNQENQKSKQIQHQEPLLQPPSYGGVAAASPPSSSSSPSHEFSFTISLHPTNSTNTPDIKMKQNPNPNPNPNTNQNPFAIDLTPADEIFFHGHLLPLHLISHLPVSPRSSTNSIDSSLPIKDLKKIQNSINHDDDNSYYDLNRSFHYHDHHQTNSLNIPKDQQKQKSKSFSLFGLPKRKKEEKEEKEKQRKLNVSQVIKRYMKMVRPFLSFRSRKNMQFHRQSYSYSGNLSFRGKNNNSSSNSNKGIKRGAYSAPVSMKNSPTNSGLLVAAPGANYHNSSSSDSTMEELQAAIQAAIAHCKKSSSMEEKKIKCQENEDMIILK
ncbi:BRI1 kinase inhibitor 1-like [Lycium ferocissimum]|uniref:BRI1 kinase inhibitor 1-like n=1 Tax=Lycium ferocissimum TaxID=112874 RepID=UPI00281649CD|nr:BRI1 kinase inhibitor 1-like [Lycium ferocissimum]